MHLFVLQKSSNRNCLSYNNDQSLLSNTFRLGSEIKGELLARFSNTFSAEQETLAEEPNWIAIIFSKQNIAS